MYHLRFLSILLISFNLLSTTYYINNDGGNDSYDGSIDTPWKTISHGIEVAQNNDILDLTGVFTLTEDSGVTSEGLMISKNITLIGFSAKETKVKASSYPGSASNRVFYIESGVSVLIENISIENGFEFQNGGGIFTAGELILNNVNVTNNKSQMEGGGIFVSGGFTEINISNSSICFNSSNGYGGGIAVETIYATTNLINCTISNNSSGYLGGGIYAYSDYIDGVNANYLNINSCTIANNLIGNNYGNNILFKTSQYYTPGGPCFGELYSTITNTIIYSPQSDCNIIKIYDVGGVISTSCSYTICSDSTISDLNGNMVNTNPYLRELDYYDGNTLVHKISNYSPAVDILLPPDYNGAPLLDQLGNEVYNDLKDIGSSEYNPYLDDYVLTCSVTNIQNDKAIVSAEVLRLGLDSCYIQHGVCWNTSGIPTIEDETTEEGFIDTLGLFSSEMKGLMREQIYYVRAYVKTSEQTFYGTQKYFRTPIYNSTRPEGEGTLENPYKITDLSNLFWISLDTLRWSNNYIQTDNINAVDTKNWYNNGLEYMGWNPIGNNNCKFTGSYNGQNYLIDSLFINRPIVDYVGLFGFVSNSEIINLILNGMIVGKDCVGGIIGESYKSKISNCVSSGIIDGSINTGGIVGNNTVTSFIDSCVFLGTVTGLSYSGGITGRNFASNISNSYSNGNIQCVSNGFCTGGLTGINNAGNISNSYSLNCVNGVSTTGGLVGSNYNGLIDNCFSSTYVNGVTITGGLIGNNYNGSIISSFWDIETSGQYSSAGGIGKTTLEMKSRSTFTIAGWDFVGEALNGIEDIWKIDGVNNDGYPYLSWQYYPLSSPNVKLSPNGNYMNVYWTSVPEATNYSVYSSEDPFALFPSEWTLEDSNINLSIWTDRKTRKNKKFYKVVAVREDTK